MISAAQIIIIIALVFTALVVACAVSIGRRWPSAPADPFSIPFGEMPGFTAEQLRLLTTRWDPTDPLRRSFAVRERLNRQTNSDGLTAVSLSDQRAAAGVSSCPLGPVVAARKLIWWRRHD